ncbi:MAG: proline--tRNA ligase [Peptococcaceae bacterium]|nr:proline--tRNA ligase [Peptococcaceae bacterium]
MRVCKLLNPTLREAPAEAEIVSHKLLYRAGLIRKVASGMYTYLPLGWRVIKKIEQIVREEMDGAGGQELMMPIIQPAEIWQETGRWDVYGPEMFRLQDRHGRFFCLGPTHEEIITDLVRSEVRSYKALPLLLYQMQNKYRDERRPRFGLMRGREFIMKDLYSFDRGQEEGAASYRLMYKAYERVFRRCGLSFRAVEADPGAIGGTGGTHEFMVLADAGEAAVVFCPACEYGANVERAECGESADCGERVSGVPTCEEFVTVGTDGAALKTLSEVADFCGCSPGDMVKSLVYQADDKGVLVLIRGDLDVNEVKLANVLADKWGRVPDVSLAAPEMVTKLFGCEAGSLGPVGVPQGVFVVADPTVMAMVEASCGANRFGRHLRHVVPGRDFVPDVVGDVRLVGGGDLCPRCGMPLKEARGIEVGQVFNLGVKYSEKLGATYLDEQGKEHPCYMGCYGIGVSRTMAAAVEQNYDENGIVWPMAIAPYQCVVVPVNIKDEAVYRVAEGLYQELGEAGVEAVLDDRDERPGVKFKDADLVGYPLRITVGQKALVDGQVELMERRGGEMERVEVGDVVDVVRERIRVMMAAG